MPWAQPALFYTHLTICPSPCCLLAAYDTVQTLQQVMSKLHLNSQTTHQCSPPRILLHEGMHNQTKLVSCNTSKGCQMPGKGCQMPSLVNIHTFVPLARLPSTKLLQHARYGPAQWDAGVMLIHLARPD